jgi:Na+/H+ antiporter NhaD/arsenite permease-like protein
LVLVLFCLDFGVGFGGNGSPIGSSAGVIVMSKSEETDEPITFRKWLQYGLPATIVSLLVATLALFIMFTFNLV